MVSLPRWYSTNPSSTEIAQPYNRKTRNCIFTWTSIRLIRSQRTAKNWLILPLMQLGNSLTALNHKHQSCKVCVSSIHRTEGERTVPIYTRKTTLHSTEKSYIPSEYLMIIIEITQSRIVLKFRDRFLPVFCRKCTEHMEWGWRGEFCKRTW